MHYPLGLPDWLVVGLALGAALSAVAAAAFAVGVRLLPEPDATQRRAATEDDRRRAEVRGYLEGIGETYAEDHPVAGDPVAFYLPGRDVAVTFDPRTYFRLEGSDTHAVLMEHELPGAALGARLPFETPAREHSDGPGTAAGPHAGGEGPPEPAATSAAFERLGLSPAASPEEVRSAYRERVKAVHPDQGGDPEAFRELREAYAVAREAAA
jgi:hypothetical protein